MSDLTREQIEAIRRSHSQPWVDALCTMALRALDAGWQPMSTAPRDGTRVLLTMSGKVTTAAWSVKNGRWDTAWSVKYGWDAPTTLHSGEGVTAWMPLPPPCAEVPHE